MVQNLFDIDDSDMKTSFTGMSKNEYISNEKKNGERSDKFHRRNI